MQNCSWEKCKNIHNLFDPNLCQIIPKLYEVIVPKLHWPSPPVIAFFKFQNFPISLLDFLLDSSIIEFEIGTFFYYEMECPMRTRPLKANSWKQYVFLDFNYIELLLLNDFLVLVLMIVIFVYLTFQKVFNK